MKETTLRRRCDVPQLRPCRPGADRATLAGPMRSLHPAAPSLAVALFLIVSAGLAPDAAQAQDLAAAYRAADAAADAVVLVEYVLEKEGRGFGGVGQRAEVTAIGTIVTPGGLVVVSSAIFPEDEDEQREPARPRDFVVRLRDASEVKAELLGRDRQVGLAFLQLPVRPGKPWPHVDLKATTPSPGDPVVLIELLPERYGYAPSFQRSAIAALVERPRALYDLDAHLQDSGVGTPVIDASGRAIGLVATDRIGETAGNLQAPLRLIGVLQRQKEAGFPMVVPAAAVLPLIASPPRDAQLAPREKSWLGVTLQPVPRALAEHLGIPPPTGAMITSLRPESPAELAGLRVHDVIRVLDGRSVDAPNEDALPRFIERVQAIGAGKEVAVNAWRDGELVDVVVTLGSAPPTAVLAEEYRNEPLGMVAQDVTMDILLARDLPEDLGGAIISELETAGLAQVGGLQRGDIIQGVNRHAIRNVGDLEAALVEAETQAVPEVIFFVLRDPDTLFIPVRTSW